MAKTKKIIDEIESDIEEAIAKCDNMDIDSKIIKAFGNNCVISGTDLVNKKLLHIPISPSLDVATKGGVPEGSWVTLYGPPKGGKTCTALQIAANAQKLGKKVRYANIEHRIKSRDLLGIKGLDLDSPNFKMFQSTEQHIMSAEDHLDIIEQYLMNEPDTVWIIDSISALMTQKEKESKISEMQRADGAKLLAKLCRQMESVVPVNRQIVICIAHIIANPSGYGSPFQETGGNKIKFQSDINIRVKKFEPWEAGGTQIGQTIDWQILWSALGSPGAKATGYLRYGIGLDREYETMVMALDANIAKKKGAWVEYDGQNHNGAEKFYSFLLDNPEIYQQLEQKVKTIYGC